MRRYHASPRLYYIMMLMVILLTISFLIVMNNSIRRADARYEELTQQKVEKIESIGTLEETLAYVQTDAYVIRVARDELNMIMPGETRYAASER